MAITIKPQATFALIKKILSGQDHRKLLIDFIDALFLGESIKFFKEVLEAKSASIDELDWYKAHFLNRNSFFKKEEIATNAGITLKTISNRRHSNKESIVIEESLEHYSGLVDLIDAILDDDLAIRLSLESGYKTIELTPRESLIVINALAVKRSTIRGGVHSTAGKQIEGPLVETLCYLFGVNKQYYRRKIDDDYNYREVDFYLLPPDMTAQPCEVKLMGKGNPESADAIFARGSKVFIASTLSEKNKYQLDSSNILWTELQVKNGFLRFEKTLKELGIPYTPLPDKINYNEDIDLAVRTTLHNYLNIV